MGQAEIMVALEHHELMLHAVLALAQRVDSTADGCYPLADVEVESLNKGGVDLPTTRRQDLRNVVDYALRHRQGARSAIDDQEQLALRIDGRPHPVPGTLQAFDGFL